MEKLTSTRNHRIAEVKSDLWSSSRPMSSLKSFTASGLGLCPGWFWIPPKPDLWQPVPVFALTVKTLSLFSEISSISVCPYCFMSCQWLSRLKVWVQLLYTLLSHLILIHINKIPSISLLFSRLKHASSLSLSLALMVLFAEVSQF